MKLPCDRCKYPEHLYYDKKVNYPGPNDTWPVEPPTDAQRQSIVRNCPNCPNGQWVGPVYIREDQRYYYQLKEFRYTEYRCADCDMEYSKLCVRPIGCFYETTGYYLGVAMADITKPSSRKRRCRFYRITCIHNRKDAMDFIRRLALGNEWQLYDPGVDSLEGSELPLDTGQSDTSDG